MLVDSAPRSILVAQDNGNVVNVRNESRAGVPKQQLHVSVQLWVYVLPSKRFDSLGVWLSP